MKKLAVLLVSYFLVASVEIINPEYHTYYLLLALTGFSLGIFCALNNDIILKGYAALQFVAMVSYVQMIIPSNFYALEYWFYDSEYSFMVIILKYEVFMMVLGLMDAYNVHVRLDNDRAFRSHNRCRGL